MATKSVTVRLDEALLAWADEYATGRGVTRTALLESAIDSFRADCESGVPELRAVARRQSSHSHAAERGVGDCPDRPDGFGHVWKPAKVDERRSCRFCGAPGRDNLRRDEEGGFFGEATRERVELFSRLRSPDSAKGIKQKASA